MPSRSTRLAIAAVVYVAVVAGLFLELFDRPGSDDYAGWSPAIAALALPACLVVAFARGRIGWRSALALGVPAAMCLGGVTLLMLWPVVQVYPLHDFTVLLALLVLGPVAMAIMAVVICLRLLGLPVRTGARRIVAVVAASGALALVASSAAWWGFWTLDSYEQGAAVLFFLFGALPLGWTLGPTLALVATAGAEEPGVQPSVS